MTLPQSVFSKTYSSFESCLNLLTLILIKTSNLKEPSNRWI